MTNNPYSKRKTPEEIKTDAKDLLLAYRSLKLTDKEIASKTGKNLDIVRTELQILLNKVKAEGRTFETFTEKEKETDNFLYNSESVYTEIRRQLF